VSNVEKYRKEIDQSPTKTQTAKAKKPKTKNSKALTKDPGSAVSKGSAVEGVTFLASILQATIFFDYFEHVANKTYPNSKSELRVVKLKTVHPVFHDCCTFFDFCARVLAFLALFTLAILSAYKLVVK